MVDLTKFKPEHDSLDFIGGLLGKSIDLELDNKNESNLSYRMAKFFEELERAFKPGII